MGLTVLPGKLSRCMYKLNLVVTQICQCPQILVLAIVRERIPTLVTVVEMSQENVCTCNISTKGPPWSAIANVSLKRRLEKERGVSCLTKMVFFHLILACKPTLNANR